MSNNGTSPTGTGSQTSRSCSKHQMEGTWSSDQMERRNFHVTENGKNPKTYPASATAVTA
jgi:hypothetical protein